MTIPSRSFNDLIQELKDAAENHPDPIERAKYNRLYQLSLMAESDVDDLIYQAKNIGVRNPAFDGDMVGWLDDDLYDDDDEDDENQ